MEAQLRPTAEGLVPEGEGWFVLNARETSWSDSEPFGVYCVFEGEERFRQLGINISVLEPGQSLGRYHAEPGHQEDFLVLAGRGTLIVEEQTRELKAWDLVHCPPNTRHMIVGAGEASSIVLSVGARGVQRGVVYPVSEIARQFGVSVETETTQPSEAYADVPEPRTTRYREGSLPDLQI